MKQRESLSTYLAVRSSRLRHMLLLLAVLWHVLLSPTATAITQVDFQQGGVVRFDLSAEYLSPTVQTMDPDEILGHYLERDDLWQPLDERRTVGMFHSDYRWQRLRLRNPNDFQLNLYLQHLDPNMLLGTFITLRDSGEVEKLVLGTHRPFRERPILHRHYLVPFVLAPEETVTLVVGRYGGSAVDRTVLIEWSTFWGGTETGLVSDGMYFGAVLLASLLVLLLFSISRDVMYLYGLIIITGHMLFTFVREGYAYQYLWPNWAGAQDELVMLLSNLGIVGAILFSRRFLQLSPTNGRWLLRVSNVYLVWCCLLMAAVIVVPQKLMVVVLHVNILLMVLYYLAVWLYSLARSRAGDKQAQSYAIAWLGYFVPKSLAVFWVLTNAVDPQPFWAYARNGELLFAVGLCAVLLADFRRKYVQSQVLNAETEARNRFVTGVSHELRTPLNGILGSAELLAETDLSPTQRHYSEIISSSGNVLLNLINDTLDLARYNEEELVLEQVPFRLDRLLAECMSTFLPEVDRKNVPLNLEASPEVPLMVLGDEFRLRQVLFNLLSNAVKFTLRGKVSLRVSAEFRGKGPAMITFVVKDSGIGIPKSALDTIFDPFRQAEASTTREFGGSGLGLAICRAIVHHMGGTIDVKSEVGRGSAFRFRIPMEVNWEEEEKRQARLRKLHGKRLLLLSDFKGMYDTLLPNLTAWGLQYKCVTDLDVAREQLASQSWDGIFAYYSRATPELLDELRRLGMNTVLAHYSSLPIVAQEWTQKMVDLPVPTGLQDIADTIMEVMQDGPAQRHEDEPAQDRVRYGDEAAILVVEDNAVNQMVTVGMLEYLGLNADVAENGQEACQLAARRNYELIFMDCNMPVMDGYSASRRILGMGQEPPPVIVALTADTQEGNRERCLDAGMTMVLHKPLSISELSECLSQLQLALADGSP